ncbi:MAG: hypothetical protein K2W96_19815 [Gemmataceae bacterium]|nr:hypothetical protein [Gemmataceae bacterium]
MSFTVVSGLSHTDHVALDVVRHLEVLYKDRTAPFAETITLPDHLPEVDDGLYGPINGDAPVGEEEVFYARRPGRVSPSRLIDRPARKTRKLTVIAGPRRGLPCVLVTAFGGPRAEKEVADTSLDEAGLESARRFWAEHALAAPR